MNMDKRQFVCFSLVLLITIAFPVRAENIPAVPHREELSPDLSSALGPLRDIFWNRTFAKDPLGKALDNPLPSPYNSLLKKFHIEGFILDRHVILPEGQEYQAEDRQRQLHYGWMTSFSHLVAAALERNDLDQVETIRRDMMDILKSLNLPGVNRKLGLVNSTFLKIYLSKENFALARKTGWDLYRWNDLKLPLKADLLMTLMVIMSHTTDPLQLELVTDSGSFNRSSIQPSSWFRRFFRATEPASNVPAYGTEDEEKQMLYYISNSYSQMLNISAATGLPDLLVSTGADMIKKIDLFGDGRDNIQSEAFIKALKVGLKRFLSADKSADSMFSLGEVLLPENKSAMVNYVNLLEFPGSFITAALVDGAMPDSKRRIFAGLANSVNGLGRVLIKREDYPGARQAFDELAKLMTLLRSEHMKDKVNQVYDELIRLHLLEGNAPLVRQLVDEFISKSKKRRKIYLLYLSADMEVFNGNIVKAWELYRQVTNELTDL